MKLPVANQGLIDAIARLTDLPCEAAGQRVWKQKGSYLGLARSMRRP
jgi:hypothetical protein